MPAFDVVESDRGGPDPGHGVTDEARQRIIHEMAHRPKHRTVPGYARDVVAKNVHWKARTVLDVWQPRNRNPYLARLVRQAYIRRGCRNWTDPVTVEQAVDDVATDLDIPQQLVIDACLRHHPLRDKARNTDATP